MFPTSFLFILSVGVSASLTQFSPHPNVTKLTKLSPQYSPSVKVHWYFPEFGFGDFSNLTRVYTCQHTGEPNRFIYGYQLALTVKPEFAKIYFSADISNVPEGHACVQVCAAFDDGLEKCSAPFLFENSYVNSTHSQPRPLPVFWNQNKQFRSYPYILRISPVDSGTSVEWYFPHYQTYAFTSTVIFTCKFNPSDFSIYDLQFVTRYETEHKNVHTVQLSHLTHRWLCVRVCVVSHFQVCGEVARYDNQDIHGTSIPITAPTPPSSELATSRQGGAAEAGDRSNSDLIFDDYEDLESLLEEPGAGMTSLKEDISISGDDVTTSDSHECLPAYVFLPCLFLFVLLCV